VKSSLDGKFVAEQASHKIAGANSLFEVRDDSDIGDCPSIELTPSERVVSC